MSDQRRGEPAGAVKGAQSQPPNGAGPPFLTDVTLHHQFVLSPDPPATMPGWHRLRCSEFYVAAHSSLPVRRVADIDQNEVAFVLGWPIDHVGRAASGQVRFPFQVTAASIDRLEEAIYSFGGRYAFVILASDLKRLYLDAGGSLSAVFSKERATAGSTVSALVMGDHDHLLRWKAPGAFPDDRPNHFWPAGLTPDPEVRRLLPNHYLDLESWRAVRHYPKSGFHRVPVSEVPSCIEEIVSLLRRDIGAVVEDAPRIYMPLTGGRDSRMLLACSREWRDKVTYVTFDYRRWRKRRDELIDLHLAKRLARRFRLRHQVVPVPSSLPPGTEIRYLRRIGFAGGSGKAWDFFHACQTHLDLSAAWLTGFAAEVGEAFYWRAEDKETDKISPAGLLARMKLPLLDRFEPAVRAWLHDVPDVPLTTVLDLAYLEHRVGGWAAPHLYGGAPFRLSMTPFCSRGVFDRMLRLPSDYRYRERLASDVISQAWPELMTFPINDYTGLARRRDTVRRKLRSAAGRWRRRIERWAN